MRAIIITTLFLAVSASALAGYQIQERWYGSVPPLREVVRIDDDGSETLLRRAFLPPPSLENRSVE